MGLGFLRAHIWPALVMLVGVTLGVVGFASDAYSLWTAGLKPWAVQLMGFLLFAAGVVALQYQAYQANEVRFGKLTNGGQARAPEDVSATRAEQAPAIEAAPPPSVPRPKKGQRAALAPEPPSRPGREYLPQSFATRYLEMLRSPHTILQEDHLLRPQIDKWMRLGGYAANVSIDSTEISIYVSQAKDNVDGAFFVRFPVILRSQMGQVGAYDLIEFDCRIAEYSTQVRLIDGELR